MKVLLYTIDGVPHAFVNTQPLIGTMSADAEEAYLRTRFPQNKPRLLDLPDADVFAALAEIERREMRGRETVPPPVGSEEITAVQRAEDLR